MKRGNVTHVFPGSNTTQGFYSFYANALSGLDRVFILKGGPGTGKSTLIRKLAADMTERGYDVELWQCSSDNDSVDGVLVPALKLAMVDGTSPHTVDPAYPGAVEEIVNLGDHWHRDYLVGHKEEIQAICKEKSGCFAACYDILADLRKELDRAEAKLPRLKDKDLEKAGDQLIRAIFREHKLAVRKFFAAAITPRGYVGYIQELSCGCQRYILTGRAQAVAKVLEQVAQKASSRGHEVNLYYSALAPDQAEAMVLPGLKIALIASASPGLEQLEGDMVVKLPGGSGSEEELRNTYLKEACEKLMQAKGLHQDLEKIYIHAMDFEAVDQVTKKLFNDILSMTARQER